MVEIEIVPEMEQTLRSTIKNIDMSMRDITEEDFAAPKEAAKDSDLEIEEINVVERCQQLKGENQQLRDGIVAI